MPVISILSLHSPRSLFLSADHDLKIPPEHSHVQSRPHLPSPLSRKISYVE